MRDCNGKALSATDSVYKMPGQIPAMVSQVHEVCDRHLVLDEACRRCGSWEYALLDDDVCSCGCNLLKISPDADLIKHENERRRPVEVES